eukprot:gene13647-21265_t
MWAHETERYVVPVQHLAQASGLAHLSQGYLNIHPTYGPWFALRALLIVPEAHCVGLQLHSG